MNWLNFQNYNKKSEELNGDYWTFINATTETIKNDNIYLDNISKIINEITNDELKLKMKKKVSDLIIENGVFFYGINKSLDLFNNDELKKIFEHEFITKIVYYLSTQEKTKYYLSDIKYFINLLSKINEINWKYSLIINILNTIKNYPDKSIIVQIIEYNKSSDEIYNKLIEEYYDYLPVEYKNYLKMSIDENYVLNKSLKFMSCNIDIGIDPRISIGPEIEANNDFYFQIQLNKQKGLENYEIHGEATLPNGNEIATKKPFYNTKEEVAKFCGLCEAMTDIGYYYSESNGNAAGQINLGLDYLDTKEAIINFYEIYGNCEELLYYISNEEGQLFRQDVYTNSRIKAISEIIGKRIIDEELTRESVIKLFNSNLDYTKDETIKGLQYKKNSVCLRGANEKDYRLEFRIPNGGCNYKTWIDNIRLYGKIMEIAKQLADIMKKDYLTNDEEKILKLKLDLQNNSLSNEEKLVILMNLLFKDDYIKQIYYNRYICTIKKIKETNSEKYLNIYNPYEPSFDEVEFIEQYHSRLESDYTGEGIIEYDEEKDEINPNIKK